MSKNMRLIQLLGDGIEELWEFASGVQDHEIQKLYKEYEKSEFESFEEFIEENYSNLNCNRVFVDEINI